MSSPNDDAMRRQMERQAQIEAALSDLPEFMAYIREVMPTLATQKDIENAIVTKLNEYDSGLKQGINSALNAVDTRLKALEERPAPVQTVNPDGGIMGIFNKVFDLAKEGRIQVPGIGPPGLTSTDQELAAVNSVFINQMKRVQRDATTRWLNEMGATGGGKMTLAAPETVEHGVGH
jgi:hypothetical protein